MKNKIQYKNIFRIIPFVLTLLLFTIISNYSFGQTTDTYTSSGTWTCPAGVTEVTVQVWGGGGAGGGSTINKSRGSGGGGGGYSTGTVSVTAGTVYDVTVGSGGTGSTENGTDGGKSSFLTITANGGGGGGKNKGTAGSGGIALGGSTNITGGNGILGTETGNAGGAGANGGAGGAGSVSDANGNPGSAPGGGGGGGERSSINGSGGAGASGKVILAYCTSPTSYEVALNEGFEGTFLPTGWTQYDCSGDGSSNIWTKGSYVGYTAPEGSNSAIIGFDASNIVNRALQTPVIDITNYTCANLSYYVFINGPWDEEMHVEITKDGGTNWISLASHGTSYGGWSSLQNISLDSYVGNSVSIRFRYYQPSDDNVSGIDGVLITGCAYPPLSITTNPTNQSICYNSSADFNVVATGTGTLSYQWKYQGNNIVNGTPAGAVYSGATTPTLSVSGTIANATYSAYTCVVSDAYGSATSSGADLIISASVAPNAPTNLTKSDDLTCPGQSVTLGGTVSSGTLEWHTGSCSGSTITSPVSPTETTTYYAKAYNSVTGCRSACSEITVNVMDNVVFVEQPESQYGCAGESLTFAVIATGAGLAYQWQVSTDGGTIYNNITNTGVYSGATTMNLAISSVSGLNGNVYRCVVTGACGTSQNSNSATLNVLSSGLSGTKTVGSAGNYTTLKAAFDAINTNGLSGNLELQVISNITEPSAAILNQWVDCAGNSDYTVTIYPTGGTRTISGNIATSLVTLNGADKVTIDGRINMTGTPNSLVFSNTSTSGSTLKFVNDATYNTLKYINIQGSATSYTTGALFFSTAGISGNSNNIVEYCDVYGSSCNGLYSEGTSGKENKDNNISYCNFYNVSAAFNFTSGIDLEGGTTRWTIFSNSFYLKNVTPNINYWPFLVNCPDGNEFEITKNYIGGRSPLCAGSKLTVSNTGYLLSLYALNVTVSNNGVSIIKDNTIENIDFTTYPSSDGTISFSAITAKGRVNVTENTIGNASTGSILYKLNNNSTYEGPFCGIFKLGDGVVQNNKIGSVSVSGPCTIETNVYGIYVAGTLVNDALVEGNTIGHATTASSIQFAATPPVGFCGILFGTAGDYTTTVSNNLIANITSSSTGTVPYNVGIQNQASGGKQVIIGNTIRDISTVSKIINANNNSSIVGIASMNETTGGHVVTANTIHSLTSTGAANVSVYGIICYHAGAASTISKNFIHSFSTTSNTAEQTGIKIYSGLGNFYNNMIRLGYDKAGTSVSSSSLIRGIWQYSTSDCNYFFNSVYIGGVVSSGAVYTYAFKRDQSAITNAKNNIFWNARTGGTGRNYAIVTNNNIVNSNYNDLFSYDAANLGSYDGGTTARTFAIWKSGTINQDLNSLNANPTFVNVTGNANVVDLHLIDNLSPMIGKGVSGTGVLVDFDSQQRRTGVNPNGPCIGADERIIPPNAQNAYGIYSPQDISTQGGKIVDCEIYATGGTPGGIGYGVVEPADANYANVNITGYQIITASNLSCTNSEFTFTTADASPSWLFGNGSNPTSSASSPATSVYTSTGYKDLIESFKVYRDFNNLTMIAPNSGSILGAPSGAGCPTTYNYTSSVAGSAGFLYEWNCTAPSGCSVSIDNPTEPSTDITFVNQTGVNQIFLVTLDIESECCGALKQVRRYITIFPGPTMPEITGNPYSTCTGGEQEVSVNNPDPTYSFEWFDAITGGTQLGSGTSYTFGTMPSGTNYYYVQSTNSFGCSSQRTQIEIEGEDADPPSADNATTCGTNDVTLSINSPSAGYTYNWYISSCGGTPLQSSTGTNFTYNVTATTNFYVAATPPGCAMSTCATVTVTVLSPTDPILWQGDDATSPNDWFIAENWQNGCIPTCATNVSIPNLIHNPDIKFDPTQVAEAKDINLQSGAVLSFSANKAVLQICGNFTHAGTLTTNNFGTIEFTGSTAQKYIYSSGTGEFNNVRINNSNAIPTLTIEGGDMIISPNGSLTFINGIIVTGLYKLVVENVATSSISGYDANKYINGKLQRVTDGASTYRFPIGFSGYGVQGFDIKPTGTSGSTILGYLEPYSVTPLQGRAFCDVEIHPGEGSHIIGEGTPGQDGILDKISFDLHSPLQWDITNPSGGISSYNITVYPSGTQDISTSTVASAGVEMLFLMKNGEPGNTGATTVGTGMPWFNETGFIACPNQTSLSGLTSFSKFNFAGASGPGSLLPVELLNFDAIYNGKDVDLDWSTATEINNDFFLVQKSNDATDFNQIGQVYSKAINGNSNTQLFYTHNDNDINSGTYYYRLKQYDFDGGYKYSHIVAVFIGDGGIFTITPNPAKESVEINYYCINEANPIVKIFDARARLVHIDKLHCVKGQNKSNINISHLAPGLYTITLITDHATEQVKLIKQ